MSYREVKLSDFNLVYQDRGEGDAIVLLHDFCGGDDYWDKVIPVLSEGNRVIIPYLTEPGASTYSKGNYEMESMADKLNELLDYLELDKVTLFGHSVGGYITLTFADKYEDRLRGFSLIHSTNQIEPESFKVDEVASPESLIPKLFAPGNLESYVIEAEKS